MSNIYAHLQNRRGDASLWTSTNPVLEAGEIGLELDTGRVKFGDGTSAWNSLLYLPAGGLAPKTAAQIATTAPLPTNTYTSTVIVITATGTLTVDGHVVVLNDRVLVKDEANSAKNGVYVCTTQGAVGVQAILTRSSDMDTSVEVPGALVLVLGGSINIGSSWAVSGIGPFTLGTTPINWVEFSSLAGALLTANNLSDVPSAATARANLGLGTAATQPSSAFDAAGVSATETARAESAENALHTLAAGLKYIQSISSPTWNISHGLGKYPAVTIVVGGLSTIADIVYTDLNNITLTFSTSVVGTAYLS